VLWISGEPPVLPLKCSAKVRYRQADQDCTLIRDGKGYQVDFAQPQRAITPGQSVVFYLGEQCLGGGVIERAQ
jgi:tRNA-specific 2-thiouridylase